MDAVMELNELARVASWSCDLHRNAMAEVSAIDVLGGVVELGDGAGHGAGEAGADDQRQQFDDGENNCGEQQHVLDAGGKVAQGGEQAGIKHRRPGLHPQQRAVFGCSPVAQSTTGSGVPKVITLIEAVAGRGQRHPR